MKKSKLIFVEEKIWNRFRTYCVENNIKITEALDDVLEEFLRRKK